MRKRHPLGTCVLGLPSGVMSSPRQAPRPLHSRLPATPFPLSSLSPIFCPSSQRYAWVEFFDPSSIPRALALDGTVVGQSTVRVAMSKVMALDSNTLRSRSSAPENVVRVTRDGQRGVRRVGWRGAGEEGGAALRRWGALMPVH